MSTLSLFRRRDPWWDVDGPAARAERRRRRLVGAIALIVSLAALGAAAFGWAIQLGIAASFGVHAVLGVV